MYIKKPRSQLLNALSSKTRQPSVQHQRNQRNEGLQKIFSFILRENSSTCEMATVSNQ